MRSGLGAAPVLPPQPSPRKASRLQNTEISPMPRLDANLSTDDDGAFRSAVSCRVAYLIAVASRHHSCLRRAAYHTSCK